MQRELLIVLKGKILGFRLQGNIFQSITLKFHEHYTHWITQNKVHAHSYFDKFGGFINLICPNQKKINFT